MSTKTETVKARINSDLKKSVEEKLQKLGLTSSDVIRMLYAQIDLYNSVPFDLRIPHIPNEETIKVLEKSMLGEDLIKVGSLEQLKKELDHDC
jgi:addiction module RelB/DinJ family antitoxin